MSTHFSREGKKVCRAFPVVTGLIITKADKGSVTTVLGKEWYEQFTNISKTHPYHPKPKISINLLTTCFKAKISQKASFPLKTQMPQHTGCRDNRKQKDKKNIIRPTVFS